jgi:hypothetical protein
MIRQTLTAAAILLASTTHAAEPQIIIDGPPLFEQRVGEALALIRDRAPEFLGCFADLHGTVVRYSPEVPTAHIVLADEPLIEIGTDQSLDSAVYSVASTMIHECQHYQFHRAHRHADSWPRWKRSWITERDSIDTESRMLRRIGAPNHIIRANSLMRHDGDHNISRAEMRQLAAASYSEIIDGVSPALLSRIGLDDPVVVRGLQRRIGAKAGLIEATREKRSGN